MEMTKKGENDCFSPAAQGGHPGPISGSNCPRTAPGAPTWKNSEFHSPNGPGPRSWAPRPLPSCTAGPRPERRAT
eukprot:scaffold393580_cov40-Prasinocladus_malaysianus.AAC.1